MEIQIHVLHYVKVQVFQTWFRSGDTLVVSI